MTTPIVTPDSDNLKRCGRCHEWKPLEAYCVDNHTKSGLHSTCRDCKAEKARVYYSANKERLATQKRGWHEANKEKIAEHARAYYQENREAIRAQQAVKRKTPEHREYMREYAKSPKGRQIKALRRGARLGATGGFTLADIEAIRVAQGNRCYLCGKTLKKYHIDHFIPLAKGGTNDPGNLRLACPSCNQRKHSKHPFELGRLL
jgi:5-methylcytosine-specific restriction endonuclease McrA